MQRERLGRCRVVSLVFAIALFVVAKPLSGRAVDLYMERGMGIEPTTTCLEAIYS